jgi:hypothetical protein
MINKIQKRPALVYLIFYSIFLFHQVYYITLGGTTWDEPAAIVGGGKQIYKALIFFQDINNPALEIFSRPEFYGPLIFVPAVLLTYFHQPLIYFSKTLILFDNISSDNLLELALFIRHLFINLYVGLVFYFIFKKILEKKGLFFSSVFLILLFLVPSFNGHLLFNFPDTALAVQFFLSAIFYLPFIGKKKNTLLLGILFALTLLTRINAILFLLTLSFYELIKIRKDSTNIKQLFFDSIKIYSIAIAGLYFFSPTAWRFPIRWLKEAIVVQFNHPNNVTSLLNGKVTMGYDAPWHYLISWFGYRLPLVYLFLFLFGTILFIRRKNKFNDVFSYSLFLIFLLNTFFVIVNPVAYGGVRHYLFLVPFIVYVSTEVLTTFSTSTKVKSFLLLLSISYLVFTQYGLGPFKYTYFNEFVNEESISYDCEINIGQPGCGDWETDYWGFGGKLLVKKLETVENVEDYQIRFCEPQFTYSMFYKEFNSYWELKNGQFVFDDQYPFTQEKLFFHSEELFDFINNTEDNEIKFLALNYHSPVSQGCNFHNMNLSDKNFSCETIDYVSALLRGVEVKMNYLYECTVEKY